MKVSWEYYSQLNGNIIQMFQTTNQMKDRDLWLNQLMLDLIWAWRSHLSSLALRAFGFGKWTVQPTRVGYFKWQEMESQCVHTEYLYHNIATWHLGVSGHWVYPQLWPFRRYNDWPGDRMRYHIFKRTHILDRFWCMKSYIFKLSLYVFTYIYIYTHIHMHI